MVFLIVAKKTYLLFYNFRVEEIIEATMQGSIPMKRLSDYFNALAFFIVPGVGLLQTPACQGQGIFLIIVGVFLLMCYSANVAPSRIFRLLRRPRMVEVRC